MLWNPEIEKVMKIANTSSYTFAKDFDVFTGKTIEEKTNWSCQSHVKMISQPSVTNGI